MDYCHSCRRHLNGALACAGCGTPVEALAPAPEDELLVYAGAASGGPEVRAPSGHRRAQDRGRSGGRGRRARRKRGKAILFGGAGLVLVAGAVGFVQMAMEPPVHDRASAVREDQEISDPQPLPSGSAAGVPSAPTAKPGSSPGRDPGAAAPAHGVEVADAHTAGPSPKPSRSAAPRPGPSSSSSAPVPSGSPTASDSPTPGGPPSSERPPPPPPPSPSPSPTCRRFLWWCA
ncbi:SCO2400 family protein [Streptomyces sp. NPDC001251]